MLPSGLDLHPPEPVRDEDRGMRLLEWLAALIALLAAWALAGAR